MYRQNIAQRTSLKVNDSYEGETLEAKVRRILNNKEPITDGAPIIHTERKDGVMPSYNIRTDRFEVALDAMEAVSKAHIAKREERAKVVKMEEKKKDGGAEPIEGTSSE